MHRSRLWLVVGLWLAIWAGGCAPDNTPVLPEKPVPRPANFSAANPGGPGEGRSRRRRREEIWRFPVAEGDSEVAEPDDTTTPDEPLTDAEQAEPESRSGAAADADAKPGPIENSTPGTEAGAVPKESAGSTDSASDSAPPPGAESNPAESPAP